MFALVEGRKKPAAQVAEGQGDRAPASIGMQWRTTMNESTVLVLVERHNVEQDAATGMQLALGQNTMRSVRGGPFFLPAASRGSLRCER